MKLIDKTITVSELKEMSKHMFGNLVKAVVDIDKSIMVVDADLHADEEKFLLEQGSQQESLWGINIYPELDQKDRVEFDSMINLRPNQQNFSRSVESLEIREKIIQIINKLIVN